MTLASRWHDVEIADREANVLATTRGRAWRLGQSRTSPAGQVYDYQGVCDIGAADALVNHQNRLVTMNGQAWRVVDATPNPILGYVELRLFQVQADG